MKENCWKGHDTHFNFIPAIYVPVEIVVWIYNDFDIHSRSE